jgi:hypothetical protein
MIRTVTVLKSAVLNENTALDAREMKERESRPSLIPKGVVCSERGKYVSFNSDQKFFGCRHQSNIQD